MKHVFVELFLNIKQVFVELFRNIKHVFVELCVNIKHVFVELCLNIKHVFQNSFWVVMSADGRGLLVSFVFLSRALIHFPA